MTKTRAMKTAVDWLEEELKLNLKKVILEGNSKLIESLFEQAKEIEKEQIIDAYSIGLSDEGIKSIHTKANAEEYYNETYGVK
jgi:hypothetical protein